MTEAAFLKDEIGPILALGIAEVVSVQPKDPLGYLGNWLLHYLDLRDQNKSKNLLDQEIEKAKDSYVKARAAEEKQSSIVLQREWRAHQTKVQERKRREGELVQRYQELCVLADEKFNVEDLTATLSENVEPRTDEEKESELQRLQCDLHFQRTVFLLAGLNKAYIAAFKSIHTPTLFLERLLRCWLYLLFGKPPHQVKTWSDIVRSIKPHVFLHSVLTYHPLNPTDGTPITRKRTIERVRRLLKQFTEDEARSDLKGGLCGYLLYQFIQAAIGLRNAHDDEVELKKSLGKETTNGDGNASGAEVETVEVVDDDEEKDPEEEAIRLMELEEARLLQLQRAQVTEGGPTQEENEEEEA